MKNFDYVSPISESLKSFDMHMEAIKKSISTPAISSILPIVNQMNSQMAEIAQSVQPALSLFSDELAATVQSTMLAQSFSSNLYDALADLAKSSMLSISGILPDHLELMSTVNYINNIQTTAQQLLESVPHFSTDIIASSLQGLFNSHISDELTVSYRL